MDSTFNPDIFLQSETTDAFDTVRTTVPAKDDYMGVVHKLGMRAATDKNGKNNVMMDITWQLLGQEELAATLNLQVVTVRQTVFLDLGPDGKLLKGPNLNVQLGQVREAVGQNNPGAAWSPVMLNGAGPARLKVSEKPDQNNPQMKRNDVVMVSKIAA